MSRMVGGTFGVAAHGRADHRPRASHDSTQLLPQLSGLRAPRSSPTRSAPARRRSVERPDRSAPCRTRSSTRSTTACAIARASSPLLGAVAAWSADRRRVARARSRSRRRDAEPAPATAARGRDIEVDRVSARPPPGSTVPAVQVLDRVDDARDRASCASRASSSGSTSTPPPASRSARSAQLFGLHQLAIEDTLEFGQRPEARRLRRLRAARLLRRRPARRTRRSRSTSTSRASGSSPSARAAMHAPRGRQEAPRERAAADDEEDVDLPRPRRADRLVLPGRSTASTTAIDALEDAMLEQAQPATSAERAVSTCAASSSSCAGSPSPQRDMLASRRRRPRPPARPRGRRRARLLPRRLRPPRADRRADRLLARRLLRRARDLYLSTVSNRLNDDLPRA